MMTANEAREIASAAIRTTELLTIVRESLPMIEKQIHNAASFGCDKTLIKSEDILDNIGFIPFTNKQIIDAVVTLIKSFGYEVEIPNSYTSIHIKW